MSELSVEKPSKTNLNLLSDGQIEKIIIEIYKDRIRLSQTKINKSAILI